MPFHAGLQRLRRLNLNFRKPLSDVEADLFVSMPGRSLPLDFH